MPRKADYAPIVKHLLKRREELLGRVSKRVKEARSGDEVEAVDVVDQADKVVQEDIRGGMLRSEIEELNQIEDALRRIKAGKYGFCESCGRRIAKARLMALPFATLCVDCKLKIEKETQETAFPTERRPLRVELGESEPDVPGPDVENGANEIE